MLVGIYSAWHKIKPDVGHVSEVLYFWEWVCGLPSKSHFSSNFPCGSITKITPPNNAPLFPFQVADLIIVAMYTAEFLMNLYLDPINYWKDGYKRFDATVLFIAYLPYTINRSNPQMHHTAMMLKGFQSLRVLKLLFYSPGMMVNGCGFMSGEKDVSCKYS